MKSLHDYAQKLDWLQDNCPVRVALDLIRGRWKPSILCEIRSGAKRFSDLQVALPKSTAQALTVQLRQLEADGVITRTVYPEMPARVEYALTDFGRSLSDVMDQLETLGVDYLERRSGSAARAS
jgi:DNA-binding HxlR family transcriptional regulator